MKKFDNYRKNLDVLRRSDQQDLNNEFIISGIIDKFSIQFELGWKVLKELLTYEGIDAAKTGSPREIIKQAYQYYPCIEEDVWLDMLSQRNNMAHIYDGNAAKERGKLITFDPNLRPPLWRSPDDAREQMLWGLGQADVVKISDNEVKFLFGLSPREGAAYIRERFGTQLVFVTCGADGCEFASLRAQGHVDGLKGLTVADTTGAGDIFGGCAVWRLLQSGKAPAALDEAELRGIAEFACRVAGRSTEKSGGISAITEMPDEVFMG